MKKGHVSKELAEYIIDRSNGRCEICGSPNICEIHHIVGRGVDASEHNLAMLCFEHHRGTNGVHGINGSELSNMLKTSLQIQYFNLGYSESEVRELMGGKLQLDEDGNIAS